MSSDTTLSTKVLKLYLPPLVKVKFLILNLNNCVLKLNVFLFIKNQKNLSEKSNSERQSSAKVLGAICRVLGE